MKAKGVFLWLIAGVFILLSAVSCSKDDNPADAGQDEVQNYLQTGSWRITEFIDSGNDETYHFTGYNFTFNNSGGLTADNGVISYTGTWSITNSSSDDDSMDDMDFNINFDLANEFEELNDDWDFITYSASKIELIDVSGGNGGTDYLTFEKN